MKKLYAIVLAPTVVIAMHDHRIELLAKTVTQENFLYKFAEAEDSEKYAHSLVENNGDRIKVTENIIKLYPIRYHFTPLEHIDKISKMLKIGYKKSYDLLLQKNNQVRNLTVYQDQNKCKKIKKNYSFEGDSLPSCDEKVEVAIDKEYNPLTLSAALFVAAISRGIITDETINNNRKLQEILQRFIPDVQELLYWNNGSVRTDL